jgi:preprotein translocase subunit SecE
MPKLMSILMSESTNKDIQDMVADVHVNMRKVSWPSNIDAREYHLSIEGFCTIISF